MALQNIGASNSDDAFYRYKMPRMVTKIEGRGNGIKTNVVNMVEIAKALARPASYTTKYFGCELGAQSKFDEKTGVSLLENFIKKYVQCYGCGNPETEIVITKSQMLQLKCAACGFVSDVDMRDKLTTFILKNPPESKKGSKDKKAMRRAEKERMKEDGAVKAGGTKKKASGSDEERVSPTQSQVDEKEEQDDEDDDDDVQWHTDTSAEAARLRIQEQLSALFQGIEKGLSKEVIKKKKYLVAAIANGGEAQLLLVRSIQGFFEKSTSVKELPLVLKALYDGDVLEEENILQWYQKLRASNKDTKIVKSAEPFIDWLQNAESESEEE
ncbi:Eukaryotic translation initiation factor 5 [Linum perenne]